MHELVTMQCCQLLTRQCCQLLITSYGWNKALKLSVLACSAGPSTWQDFQSALHTRPDVYLLYMVQLSQGVDQPTRLTDQPAKSVFSTHN